METNNKRLLVVVSIVATILGVQYWNNHGPGYASPPGPAVVTADDQMIKDMVAADNAKQAEAAAKEAAKTPKQRAAEKRAQDKAYAMRLAQATKDARTRSSRLDHNGNDMTPYMARSTVERYLQRVLNDPDSLQMGDCGQIMTSAVGLAIDCQFRAKNGYGGLMLARKTFYFHAGAVISMEND